MINDFNKEKNQIIYNEKLWRQIEIINEKFSKYNFDNIQCGVIKTYSKNTTKEKYGDDRFVQGGFTCKFKYKEFLAEKIYLEMPFFDNLISKYKSIWEAYELYEKLILDVFNAYRLYKDMSTAPQDLRNPFLKVFKSSEDRFEELKKYEEDLLDKRTYSPCFPLVDLRLSCTTYYNSYSRTDTYGWRNILECYNLAREKVIREGFIKHERAIVSDNLRYDVFKRDSFRCRICGAKASDGIKLEVDHIIPIAKGGKSILSNLQTLCERCNRGKGTKSM